ncbi:RNA polymerase I enhancer binding protein, partial [Linderina pennispora]
MTARREEYSDGALDGNEDDLSLVELLRTYPGLLSDRVETVAQALAQATMAASDLVLAKPSSSRAALQRIRHSKNTGSYQPAPADPPAASRRPGAPRTGTVAGRRWHTQKHLQALESEGVVFTKGKFTDAENAVIETQIREFAEQHGISHSSLYEYLFQRKHRGQTGKQLRKELWPLLSEALPTRQIQAIYHHVRRKYHPHNYQGAWTEEEDRMLARLVGTHGAAWEAISMELGRMGTNCRDRWRYLQS